MTIAAYSQIIISDGTVSAVLTDGTNYALVEGGWAPGVAPLRLSTLGGRGPYEDVAESITVNVLGTTGAVCLANLAKLSQLLDQAEQWAWGAPVSAVTIAVQPQGSTLAAALQAVILGRADTGGTLGLPATFNDLLMCYEIPGVQLRFVRRGLWLGPKEVVGPSILYYAPTIASVTFANPQAIPSPLQIYLSSSYTPATQARGFVIIANDPARIQLLQGEALASTGFTSVADATNHASGGYVLRYTPTATVWGLSTRVALTVPATCRRMALFANVRNNSATLTFRVGAIVSGLGGETSTTPVLVDASVLTPRLFYLGTVSVSASMSDIGLQVMASSIVGPPTLDIDFLVVVDVSDNQASVLAFDTKTASIWLGLMVDPRVLTDRTPMVRNGDWNLNGRAIPYTGDANLTSTGTSAAVMCLGMDPASPANWVTQGAFTNFTLQAARYPAFLTPQ